MEGQIAGLGPDLVSALDPEEGPGLGVGPNLALNLEPAAEEAAKRVAKEKELAKVSIKKKTLLIILEGSLNKCRLSCPILDEKEATKEHSKHS